MAVRRATRDVAGDIACVINAAFAGERALIDGERTSVEDVRALLDTGEFLVAIDQEDRVAGCVYVENNPPTGYLALLAVSPSQQRAGLGKQLVAAAEERCWIRGCSTIEMQVLDLRPDLPSYYHRFGYVESGTRSPASSAAARAKRSYHFIHMSKHLR
jgi:predicted N-acetyltransferase YhbS